MVPKQCPLLRSTFWYLICCAACFGSRDNSKYLTYPLTQPPTNLRPTWPRSDFLRLFDSGFAPSALSIRLNSWWHGMIQSGTMPFAVFANCPSSELREDCCQYSRAFLLWALLILAVSRAARWLEVRHPDDMVPKQCPFRRPTFWYLVCCATCLGSRDNSKYHTYIPTYIHDLTRISIDCLTPASRLRRSASVWTIRLTSMLIVRIMC